MQDVIYSDINFNKENSLEYILSIRYATDGLSFCINDINHKLLFFSYLPFQADSEEELLALVKSNITENPYLSLKYKKVNMISCNKNKALIPQTFFDKSSLFQIYRHTLPITKNDILVYRNIKMSDSYIIEAFPRSFVNFLRNRYTTLFIINSAYPFIIHSLKKESDFKYQLFLDIHTSYFDILITENNNIKVFNSHSYSSDADILYFTTLTLTKSNINLDETESYISGHLIHKPAFQKLFNSYFPHGTFLQENSMKEWINNKDLNGSSFIHLLGMSKCE